MASPDALDVFKHLMEKYPPIEGNAKPPMMETITARALWALILEVERMKVDGV